MAEGLDVEGLVNQFYRPLYQYAFSLTRSEPDACDLTQQTFYILQTKGHQLRDPSKVKTWLFTTLHREFLNSRRRFERFPHLELDEQSHELPPAPQKAFNCVDTTAVLEALARVEAPHQAAVALFYLEDCSYKEIADILGVPIGTVKSRLSRGLAQLQQLLADTHFRPSQRGTDKEPADHD